MKKHYLVLLLITLSSAGSWAQQVNWGHAFLHTSNGDDSKEAMSVALDDEGNTYMAGYFEGTIDFDPGPAVFEVESTTDRWDGFVVKFNANGEFEWIYTFGAQGNFNNNCKVHAVEVDNNGDVVFCGHIEGTVDFDPEEEEVTISSPDNVQKSVFGKLDSDGNFLLAREVVSNGTSYAYDIAFDSMNNYFVTGLYGSTNADFDPGPGEFTMNMNNGSNYVSKFNSSGEFIWAKQLGALSRGIGVICDSQDNVIIQGVEFSTGDYDPGEGVYMLSNSSPFFGDNGEILCKLDNEGNFIWAGIYGAEEWDAESNQIIAIDSEDNIAVVGHYRGAADLDPFEGAFTVPPATNDVDGYIIKVSSAGDFIFAKTLAGDDDVEVLSIAFDANDNIIVGGRYDGAVDFDPGPGVVSQGVSSTRDELFMLSLDAQGEFSSLHISGIGSLNPDKYISCMRVNSQNTLVTTGMFHGSVGIDFDPGPDEYLLNSGNNYGAMFLMQYQICNDQVTDVVSACDSFTWIDGNTYTEDNNTATWTLTNVAGCDSVITLDLTINTSTSSTDVIESCGDYTWIDGNTYTASNNTATHVIPSAAGCDSTITLDLTIGDFENPVPDLDDLTEITSECEVTTLTAPTATDNCEGSVTGTHNVSFPITSSTTITWTYDDGNGNTSTQTQAVVIDDVTAPIADSGSLSDVNAECEVSALTPPTATDNCEGAVTGIHNATFPITSSTTVTWTYDDGNGNTATQTQEVIIDDVTAPVADAGVLADVNAECAVTSLTAPTATDNCSGSISGTHNATLPISSSTSITWTYDDGNGNTSTQSQEVVINDVTAPVASAGTLADVTAQCEVTSLTAPTAIDNCSGTVIGTPNVELPIATQGSFTITWTFDDGNGNTSTQTQSVIIDDTTAPVADNAILSNVADECSASPSAPTATDNCGVTITGTPDVSFPITSAGTTTVTWTYDDGNGNTSAQTQDVVITPIDNSVTQLDAVTLTAGAMGYSYQWLDCNNGNEPIEGATEQTFNAPGNGNYAVKISNGECMVTSDCVNLLTVGQAELSSQSLSLYPNPAVDRVFIGGSNGIDQVTLFNSTGQEIPVTYNMQSAAFDLPDEIVSGVYFVVLKKGDVRETHRIVVK